VHMYKDVLSRRARSNANSVNGITTPGN